MPAPIKFIYGAIMIEVVAAVIRRGGKILICQRPQGKNLAGFWEFPGGKVEEGESKRAALVRECREELGTVISVGREICSVVHDYGTYSVHIAFFECAVESGEPAAKEHSKIVWTEAGELKNFSFCPADCSLIKMLSE